MHASKVDFIYQANLTGLGTPLHNARHMIRDEHDIRIRALFEDSFGVDSAMGALTIRGAVDVKNLFDFYLHRHGNETLTDIKIRDGAMTGEHVEKKVSCLDNGVMARHTELAKSARGYRQGGPDISDMFLRICGYEYFYPQAPNAAMRTNIMANNPEAPAAYVMANKVIQQFVKKLSFEDIDHYRSVIGDKLDNLIAQSFMDFFSELGKMHACDAAMGERRSSLKMAAKETATFGFAFDSYEKQVSRDALSHFDLFLDIYAKNLEKQLEGSAKIHRKALEEQIEKVRAIAGHMLAPDVVKPGSDESRQRARYANHSYENTDWRGVR